MIINQYNIPKQSRNGRIYLNSNNNFNNTSSSISGGISLSGVGYVYQSGSTTLYKDESYEPLIPKGANMGLLYWNGNQWVIQQGADYAYTANALTDNESQTLTQQYLDGDYIRLSNDSYPVIVNDCDNAQNAWLFDGENPTKFVRYDSNNNVGVNCTASHKFTIGSTQPKAGSFENIVSINSNDTSNQFRLKFGLNNSATATNRGAVIQAVEEGVSYRNLLLNPDGGNVGVGTFFPFSKTTILGGNSNPSDEIGTLAITTSSLSQRLLFGVNNSSTMYSYIQSIENGVNKRDLILNPIGGNIGIGTGTNAIATKFQIRAKTDVNIGFRNGEQDATAIQLNAYNDAVNANIPMEFKATKFQFTIGNVIIGDTTATHKLNVDGGIKTKYLYSNDSTGFFIGNVSDGLGSGTGGMFCAYNANPLLFYTNGVKRLDISGGGDVSLTNLLILNQANNSVHSYHQLNRDGITTENMFVWRTAGTPRWFLGQRSSYGEDGFSLFNTALGADNIYFKPNGNVGIGTSTPSYKLEVEGGVYATGEIKTNSTLHANLTYYNGLYSVYFNDLNKEICYGGHVLYDVNTGLSGRTTSSNTILGYGALFNAISGQRNVMVGVEVARFNNYASNNTILGYKGGYNNYNGDNNVYVGTYAGYGAAQNGGGNNVGIGFNAMYSVGAYTSDNIAIGVNSNYYTTGNRNVGVGSYANFSNTTGSYNTSVGNNAGYSNSEGNYNVFIGNKAGYYETGSNMLYISNSETSTPLIKGDFAAQSVTINGTLTSNNLKSLSAAGYTKTTEGLIIQWGTWTSSSDGDITVYFPMAFPNACFVVVCDEMIQNDSVTKYTNRFVVNRSDTVDGTTMTRNYIAMGY